LIWLQCGDSRREDGNVALKPLAAGDVRVGEPLRRPVYDRHGVLLLRAGVAVASAEQKRGLVTRGFLREAPDTARGRDESGLRERVDTGIFGRIATMATTLRRLHGELLGERPGVDLAARIGGLAASLLEAVDDDADAALAALQIEAIENGFVERHLHVAALCAMIGRAIGQPPATRRALAGAALTYDIGFAVLHEVLDGQVEPLSAAQRDELQAHPRRSVELLQAAGIDNACWLDAVRQHHERIDGSGYPAGLDAAGIGPCGRMLAIADIYTAMIRPRIYRHARQARIALREIFLERGRKVDEDLAALFIKELGIHPPGSFVRLRSGEIAVVTRRCSDAAHPALRCVVARDGTPLVRPAARDCRQADWAIVEAVDPTGFRCVLGGIERLWTEREASPPA
jgi:hypothetical protein